MQMQSGYDKENAQPDLVRQVCTILEVKNPSKLVQTVQKLQTVLRCVPKMEQYIREIGRIVFPELKSSERDK